MDSPDVYPCSLFRPPIFTLFDFWQGLNFTTFHSLYQQLNYCNPPSLHYVQQHWIVLVNDLFPDSHKERTKKHAVNKVGQELKFQAFGSAESSGGEVDLDDETAGVAKWDDSRRRYKSQIRVDGTTESFEAEIVSLGADSNTYSAKEARFGAALWRSAGVEAASSEKSKLLAGIITGEASAEARPVTENSEEVLVRGKDGSMLSHVQGHDYSRWRYRGTRAGKSRRDSSLRKLSDSVVSLALEADVTTNSQIHQTEQTDEIVTTDAQQRNGHDAGEMPSTSGGRDEDGTVRLRFAPRQQRVDSCSLSQSELDSAITELVCSVQYEMDAVHADRLKLLYKTGWSRASATPRGRRN